MKKPLKLIAFSILIAFTLTTLTDSGRLAIAFIGSSATASGNAASQLGQIAESTSAVQSFQTDLFTGRAQTSVPIFVPPGRKNIQPSLSLNYSSSAGNGPLGMGWSLDLGFIQRDTKRGVPKYDSADKFIFAYQGVSSELVLVDTNEYRAKDESLFLKFVFDSGNNQWVVTDKSGIKHYFGGESGSRQTNGLGTFKWALSKVIDTVGNYMSISYTTDDGQLYLSEVAYNGNESESLSHTHKVEFYLEDRNDDSFSYGTGARVETNKRYDEILIKVKDAEGTYYLARKYVMGYEYSSATLRSQLTSVTEYGTDGTTSLPVTTFTYNEKALGFDPMINFDGIERLDTGVEDYDYFRAVTLDRETKVDYLDVNGDGLNDRIQAKSSNNMWKVQLNNSETFDSLKNFDTIYKATGETYYDYISYVNEDKEQITDFADINADGLPDRIVSVDSNSSWVVQLNDGQGFESSNANWGTISRKVDNTHYDHIRYSPPLDTVGSLTWVDFFDINGDGLPDRIMAEPGDDGWKVQLNTATGFSAMVDWGDTERMISSSNYDAIRSVNSSQETFVDMADLNGDGLPDRVQASDSNGNWKVQWNTGSGFTTMEDFGPIETLSSGSDEYFIRHFESTGEQNVDLFDINGDGLPDRVQAADNNQMWSVQYNTGTGFTSLDDFGPISFAEGSARYSYPRWTDNAGYQAVDIADFDGDGLPDRIQAKTGNIAWKIQKNKGPFPDLLKEIKNGRGGKTTITYTPSTQFENKDSVGKNQLPFPVQLVTKVEQSDSLGNTYATNYKYEGGLYNADEREFRGFKHVTVIDDAGTETRHTFGQDNSTKGRLLEKEVWGYIYDAVTQTWNTTTLRLFSKEVTTWDDAEPWGGSIDVTFVFVGQVDAYIYDGDGTYKQTRQVFTYDDYGNLASTTESGDLAVSGDERKTENSYVYGMSAPGAGSGTYIVNTLSKTTLYDSDLTTKKAERYFYYDQVDDHTTQPTTGLLRREEEWLNTASGCSTAGVCANNPKTTMTYDDYGNVETITDARGYTTTNTYDTTYNLFLVEIENALTHTREFTYDPWLAQILTSTDQNGVVTETQYDVLGRVVKVIAPLDNDTYPTQEFAYDYPASNCTADCITRVTAKVKSSNTLSDEYLITYTFTDGLGREIQRRSPAEDGGDQIVSGNVEFDERGQTAKQFVPYTESISTSYIAPNPSTPHAEFSYDAVGRRVRIDYPDETVSRVIFSDFVKTTVDQRGKQKRYTNDAYGRLAKVEEFNAGSTYTTLYEYDVLNNLLETTDNASNVTTITYDTLSRKIGMIDPDMGTWSYTYDLNDNLLSQTDAKSQTINFTYDELNRVTCKNLPGLETNVIYTYDTEPGTLDDDDVPGDVSHRKGRLTQVYDASGYHAFAYDAQGRVIMDRKTVDSNPYDFIRTYDSMGRVRTLTYPDTEVVTYTYNLMGEVETITGVKSAATTYYIKDVDYNASGQIIHTQYGNDVTSDYTYDSETLRLENILTKKPDTVTKLQDLTYEFDNNGNVDEIIDTVNSMSQSFTYDDLNRLTQAIGSAYGTQNFTYDSIGNMTHKAGRTMSYGAGAAGPHAVTAVSWSGAAPTFCRDYLPGECEMTYDANGNMIVRGGDSLAYDSENRLKEMKAYVGEEGSTNYTLKPGWNVISFTHLPDNHDVSAVLVELDYDTDYDQVSTWDEATDTWKHWVNDADFNDFEQFEFGKTYEIYNKTGGDLNFTVEGRTAAVDITHNIVVGDNFISPAIKAATNITTVLSALTFNTDYSDVKRFNATSQLWESYDNNDFTQFEPGKGYVIVGLQNASFEYGKTETTTTYVYDATGARVKKNAGGTTTIYLGKDYDIVGGLSTKYIFLGDRRVALKDSTNLRLYFHEDHINSSNVITDASGDQAGMYEYDPYGSTVTQTGSAEVKHRYTGQEADDSTNLYYYNARYYDPQLGRFITADPTIQHPTDPQDFNRYAYCRNNPIRFTDPSGLGWLSKIFAAVFAVVAVVVTWGAATPVIIAAATFAGALGGVAGAAIAKENLLRGALQGAAIGAAVGAGATAGAGGANITMGSGGVESGGAAASAGGGATFGKAIQVSAEVAVKLESAARRPTAENSSHPEMKQTAQFTNDVSVSKTSYDAAERHRLAMFTINGMMNMWNPPAGGPMEGPGTGSSPVLSPTLITQMRMAQDINPAREVVPEVVYFASNIPKALSKFWNSLKNWRKGIKRDNDGNYYDWDYTHGDIEKYDKRGRHLGSVDPETGRQTKDAVPGRRLDI